VTALFFTALVVLSAWYVLPYSVKRLQISQLRRCCKKERLIVLTYDDGPSIQLTKKIVEKLKIYGAVATFFFIGKKLKNSEELVSLVVESGHVVGSHSFDHLHAWKRSPVAVFDDISQGLRAARLIRPCNLFRPPYGKITLATWLQVSLLKCKHAWWTIDSTDSWERPRDIEEILEIVRQQGGGVVLLHDLERPEKISGDGFTVALTIALLELAVKENFRVGTYNDALGLR